MTRIITNHEENGRIGTTRVVYAEAIISYRIPNGAEGHELIAQTPKGEIMLSRKGSVDECLKVIGRIDDAVLDGTDEIDLRMAFKPNGK